MTRPDREAGYTLIELLVSLTLLGLAAVLVTQGFAADRAVLAKIDGRAGAGESVAAAQDLIRDRLEALFAATRYEESGTTVDMDGAADRLDFMAAAPGGPTGRRIETLRLAVAPGGELSFISPAGESTPLLHGVERLELAYFGPGSTGAAPTWRPDWTRQGAPPQAIRVRLDFAEGDRRSWPELIVRPASMVDVACVLDTETALCRGRP